MIGDSADVHDLRRLGDADPGPVTGHTRPALLHDFRAPSPFVEKNNIRALSRRN
jgi:hypothetical protein